MPQMLSSSKEQLSTNVEDLAVEKKKKGSRQRQKQGNNENAPKFRWDHPSNGGRLTAFVEAVELAEVAGAEAHPLTNHVQEVWDLGDDGGFRASAEGRFAVVHDGAVVVGNTKSTGHCVITCSEVVFFTWEYHKRRSEVAQSSLGLKDQLKDQLDSVSLSINLTQHYRVQSGPT